MSKEPPVRLLKITGLGRSGSTILDVVLGNHPDIESVGEVGRIFRTGWIGRESLRGINPKRLRPLYCTCGKRLDIPDDGDDEECPFWRAVRREWVERVGEDDIERYPALQDDFDLDSRWPRLLYERWRRSDRFRSYALLTQTFFESIRAVSGKPVVVDSSTIPVQAYGLGMMPGIDLYLIHLVRDGRGVIASQRRPYKKYTPAGFVWDRRGHPIWKTIVRWIVRNLEAELVCAQLGRRRTVRLRYEDFVANPRAALKSVGSLIDLDLKDVADAASSGEPMPAGHNVGGNATKESGTITLRPNAEEWRTALTPRDKRISWVLLGWLMRRYGYRR